MKRQIMIRNDGSGFRCNSGGGGSPWLLYGDFQSHDQFHPEVGSSELDRDWSPVASFPQSKAIQPTSYLLSGRSSILTMQRPWVLPFPQWLGFHLGGQSRQLQQPPVNPPRQSDALSEDTDQCRRKKLVMMGSIGFITTFNLFYLHRHMECLPWLSLTAEDRATCFFASFLLFNCFCFTVLLLLVYLTSKWIHALAFLFLAYVDLAICFLCLYHGMFECFAWLATVVSMAFYLLSARLSRLFMIAVVLEGGESHLAYLPLFLPS